MSKFSIGILTCGFILLATGSTRPADLPETPEQVPVPASVCVPFRLETPLESSLRVQYEAAPASFYVVYSSIGRDNLVQLLANFILFEPTLVHLERFRAIAAEERHSAEVYSILVGASTLALDRCRTDQERVVIQELDCLLRAERAVHVADTERLACSLGRTAEKATSVGSSLPGGLNLPPPVATPLLTFPAPTDPRIWAPISPYFQ